MGKLMQQQIIDESRLSNQIAYYELERIESSNVVTRKESSISAKESRNVYFLLNHSQDSSFRWDHVRGRVATTVDMDHLPRDEGRSFRR